MSIVTHNQDISCNDETIIFLKKMVNQPRYEKWNQNTLTNLSLTYEKSDNEILKKLITKLLLNYVEWCKINNKNYLDCSMNQIVITPVVSPNLILRELTDIMVISNNSYEDQRKVYYRIWLFLCFILIGGLTLLGIFAEN